MPFTDPPWPVVAAGPMQTAFATEFPMTARLPALLLAAAVASLLAAAPALAQSSPTGPGPLRYEPFALPVMGGSTMEAERGTFSVPENRNDPRSRRIDIGFVRLRALTPTPGAPIVYLAGGPGGSGVDTMRGPRHLIFQELRKVADVILLDQRGTGLSNHTPLCSASAAFDAATPLTQASYTAYYRDTVDRCVDVWREAGVDLAGYTTVENADDIEALRQVLGVPRVNLMGISYGSHLTLATISRHPDSIGRIALTAIEGLDQTVKRPDRVDAVMLRIAAAIDAHPGRTEPFVEVMRRVHARYATPQPLVLTAPDGRTMTLQADAFVIRMMAGVFAKNPSSLPRLVAMYEALDKGETGAFAEIVYGFMDEPMSLRAMPLAMDLASGVTPRRAALIEAQAHASLTGLAINFPMPQLAGAIPGLDLGDGFRREAVWSGPALIFSGDLDLRTPMEEMVEATAGLSGRSTVIVRNGGHDLYEAHPDIQELLVSFFSGRDVPNGELVLPAP